MKTAALAGSLLLLGLVSAFQAGALLQVASLSAEPQKLLPSDGATGETFGQSVAVSGGLALIGAPRDDDNGVLSGSAYVFQHDGDDWEEEEKLLARDGVLLDAFGWSVSLSDDTVMIGSICSLGRYGGHWCPG